MAEDVLRIRDFVRALVQRERALLVLRIALRTALLLLTVVLWGTVATVVRLDRPTAALVATGLGGIGLWVAVALPLLVGWRPTGDPIRHARRVEELRPALRGRLLTAVEHTGELGQAPAVGQSEALLALVLRKAVGALGGLGPADVYPARPIVRVLGLTGAAWLIGMLAVLVVGPGDVARFWFAGSAAHAEARGVELRGAEDLARVGDIVVKYTYPDYTGLPPKVVPNGTGDVSAPPGTTVEVTARSADPMQAAGLVAYDERLEARVGDDGRNLTGVFQVRPEEGAYHVLVYRGAEPERSRDFAITPEDDLPPDVMLDAGEDGVVEVALDSPFPITWQARDDYGVRKVAIALDGKDTEQILDRPDRRRAELGGTESIDPRDLGLKAGDRVRMSVVAWDNDTVGGSKRGESQSVELVVLGASGLDQRQSERRAELLEKMIPVLARFLTDPSPPGHTSGELSTWGEQIADRYQPLSDTVEKLWKGMNTETQDRAIVEAVLASGRKLVRYTQTSFEPGSAEVPRDDAFQMVAELADGAVVSLEDGILAFHELLRNDALGEIVEQADELATAADRLEQALAEQDPDVQELLSQLDQLERMMDQLAKSSEKLDDGGLKEFLNTRRSETQNLMEEIRKAIAENRLDEARKMMERLSKLMRETSQGIRDELDRRVQQGSDAQAQAEDLKKELEAIEQDQKKLQTEVQSLRKEDRDVSDRMATLWAELERRAADHERSAQAYGKGLDTAGRPFFERERASGGIEEAAQLRQAIGARDVNGARTAVGEAQIAWAGARHALDLATARGLVSGPGRKELGTLIAQLGEIERLLDQLDQAEQQVDPKTLEKSRELEGKQRDLQNRLQQASERAKSLEQEFPVRPQGMQEALDDASGRMEQASDDLKDGQPMQAEGSQGVAAQRVRDAIESIEQAQQQAQQMQQEMQGQGGEQPQKPDDQKNGSSMDRRVDLEIPGREEFRTPEEYRRALLEGMEGEVPEEYRTMKQRYFEELVHQ
ncbi:MAG: DUF4175 family protein [Myxococcota bacterium]